MTVHPLVVAIERTLVLAREMDAPLADRLRLIADEVRDQSSLFAESVDRMVARLQTHGAGASAPGAGDKLLPFLLPDSDGRLVAMGDLLASGPLMCLPTSDCTAQESTVAARVAAALHLNQGWNSALVQQQVVR